MRDLVGGEIIEHVARREDEPPRERQRARGRARAPAARLVADRDSPHRHAEAIGIARDRGLEIALGLALEVVGDAPRHMVALARDTQQTAAIAVDLGPYRAARAAPVRDRVDDAAQGKFRAMRERRGLGQAAEPRRDPGAVLFGEFAASRKLPRGGMVSTASRVTAMTRSV